MYIYTAVKYTVYNYLLIVLRRPVWPVCSHSRMRTHQHSLWYHYHNYTERLPARLQRQTGQTGHSVLTARSAETSRQNFVLLHYKFKFNFEQPSVTLAQPCVARNS